MRGVKCKNSHFIAKMPHFIAEKPHFIAKIPHFIAKRPFWCKKRVKCPIGTNRTTTYEQSDNKTGQSFASKRWQYLIL